MRSCNSAFCSPTQIYSACLAVSPHFGNTDGTIGHSRSGAAVWAPKKGNAKGSIVFIEKKEGEKRKGSFLPILVNFSTRIFILSH